MSAAGGRCDRCQGPLIEADRDRYGVAFRCFNCGWDPTLPLPAILEEIASGRGPVVSVGGYHRRPGRPQRTVSAPPAQSPGPRAGSGRRSRSGEPGRSPRAIMGI